MAQTSFPFENVDTTETQFSQMFRNLNAGVNGTPAGTELKVTAGTGLAVSVAAGQAMVRGHYYISTAAEALTLTAANGSNPRIDAIVLTLDPTANSIILAKVDGTPAASPVAPTLTQTDAGVYQYLLATVLVPAAATVPSTITDTRGFMGSRFGLWSTAGRPTSPVQGQVGFNTTLSAAEGWNGSAWVLIGAAPNANAISNGDFSKWTRGTSFSITSGGWNNIADRWISYYYGGTLTVSKVAFTPGTAPVTGYEGDSFIRLNGSTGNVNIGYRIEDVRTFAGQTVTLSFWAKSASAQTLVMNSITQFLNPSTTAGQIVFANPSITTSWQRYTFTGTFPSLAGQTIGANSSLQWELKGAAGNALDLWGVQLEAGTTASDFKPAGGNKTLDTVTSGSAGFDGVLVSTGSSTNPSGSGTPAWAGFDVAGKNKIINGGFDFWQRGTSVTNPASGNYLADRWAYYADGTGATKTISQQTFTPGAAPIAGYESAYFYRFNQSVAGSGGTYQIIAQRIEDVRTFAGQTVTLSFFAKAVAGLSFPSAITLSQNFGSGGSGAVSTNLGTPTLTTSWQRFSYTVTLPSISGKTIAVNSTLDLNFFLPVNVTQTIDIWGVQLEAGSVATPFSRAGGTLQGELAACQRYYQRQPATTTFCNFAYGIGFSTTQVFHTVPLKTTMRVAPTSIDTASLRSQDTVNGVAITSLSLDAQSTENMAIINAVHASGITQFRPYFLSANGTTSAYVGFSAEL